MVDSDPPDIDCSEEPQNPDAEMLARMRFSCDRISEHAAQLVLKPSTPTDGNLVEELQRLRNVLVLSGETGITFFVGELLAVFNHDSTLQPLQKSQRIDLLNNAIVKIEEHLNRLELDSALNDNLHLLPLINDCRAIRDEALLSDSLMLVLGLEPSVFSAATVASDQCKQQYNVWADYAEEHHESFVQRLLYWWADKGKRSSRPLVRQLKRFAVMTDLYACLQPLTTVFQCCALIADAVEDEQLEHGPAIRSLFSQLERCVHSGARREMHADLVSADLLRSCLFYVSQIQSTETAAVNLKRSYQLDCLHGMAENHNSSVTQIVGSNYHLLKAIREYIVRESTVLRSEALSRDTTLPANQIIKARVRFRCLEPVFALVAGSDAVKILQQINDKLEASCTTVGRSADSDFSSISQLISQLESCLENKARSSVVKASEKSIKRISAREMYLDIATDACLMEARGELQEILQAVLINVQSDVPDERKGAALSTALLRINNALQILPLPELSPLIISLADIADRVCKATFFLDLELVRDETTELNSTESLSVSELLAAVFTSLQDYLTWVFQPQPTASQYLSDADESLEQLSRKLADCFLDATEHVDAESLLDDLSLPDIANLTLNVEDELLLDSFQDQAQLAIDSSLRLVLRDESLQHVEVLEKLVQQSLNSSDSQEQLPSEKMLRSLHDLTSSAQSLDVEQLTKIVQPMQRVSLLLHRQGRVFEANDIRFIGELVEVLRSGLHSITASSGDIVELPVVDINHRLQEFVARLIPGEKFIAEPLAANNGAMSTQSANDTSLVSVSPLSDVFDEESSDLLEKLRSIVSAKDFNLHSVQSALTVLHTLKGSARMLGMLPISECAHDIEARVLKQSLLDEQLKELKAGHRSLHSYLLQATSRRLENTHAPQTTPTHTQSLVSDVDLSGTIDRPDDEVLDLSTELVAVHARLDNQLSRLSTIFSDFDSASNRLQQARSSNNINMSSEADEILADFDTTRTLLSDEIQKTLRQQVLVSKASTNLQQAVVHSRLVRFDEIRDRLNNTINELARVIGLSVRLEIVGGELMIDRTLFKQLHAPLDHLARNAVVHGIERVEERLSKSKSSTGCIKLSVSIEEESFVVRFADDGRGLDTQRINQILSKRGQATIGDDQDLEKLLFSSGFSTVSKPDSLSGHGLGLSAVVATMVRIKGQAKLRNIDTEGFCIELRVPRRTVAAPVLLVDCNKRLFGIPLNSVKSVMLDKSGSVSVSADTAASPVALMHLLSLPDEDMESSSVANVVMNRPTVTVQVDSQRRLISVDKVIGYRELVIQSLGPQMAMFKYFNSGSVLPDGQQVLILDVEALEFNTAREPRSQVRVAQSKHSSVALVVDDSPTSRSVIKNMLEERGIQVNVCKDGLEALRQVSVKVPDIIIVDLEMPRLDGFGLMRRLSEDFSDTNIGIVAISSRDSESRRSLAENLGAVAFLTKPYTNQQFNDSIMAAGVILPDLTIA